MAARSINTPIDIQDIKERTKSIYKTQLGIVKFEEGNDSLGRTYCNLEVNLYYTKRKYVDECFTIKARGKNRKGAIMEAKGFLTAFKRAITEAENELGSDKPIEFE